MNVEVENIKDHDMHSEQIYISPETAEKLNNYKTERKRIIAVGTTSVRTLESMSDNN
jgi:S-adenosylmethionine:tRNA ribosyltransferase-isomerase